MQRERRSDLTEFLHAKRRALTPADVGLAGGGRRRAPGLRREELALLAGVSVSWYTWLEQGRPINASAEVLDSLARVLRLDPVERLHLFELAGHRSKSRVTVESVGGARVTDDVRAVLNALEPAPAYVLGPYWDVLAWNRTQALLSPRLEDGNAGDVNFVAAVFTDPSIRALIGDWDSEARRVLSQFRADIAPLRNEPRVKELVDGLVQASDTFARWWPLHDVAPFTERTRLFHHPIAGDLRFRYDVLIPASEPLLRICVHIPIQGDDSLSRLLGSNENTDRLLGSN